MQIDLTYPLLSQHISVLGINVGIVHEVTFQFPPYNILGNLYPNMMLRGAGRKRAMFLANPLFLEVPTSLQEAALWHELGHINSGCMEDGYIRNREEEFLADRYAYYRGRGRELKEFLYLIAEFLLSNPSENIVSLGIITQRCLCLQDLLDNGSDPEERYFSKDFLSDKQFAPHEIMELQCIGRSVSANLQLLSLLRIKEEMNRYATALTLDMDGEELK